MKDKYKVVCSAQKDSQFSFCEVWQMNARTLYVSDLDGTLLNSNQRLSEFTIKTINALVREGMIFSYATARSYVTAGKITRGISPLIPVIVYNGAFILKDNGQKIVLSNYFDTKTTKRILDTLIGNNVFPIVYSYINGAEKFSYVPNRTTIGMESFLASRYGDIRSNPVTLENLGSGEAFYFTCIDTPEKLLPLYNLYKDEFQCVFQKDIYSGEQWLEIMPLQATKANSIQQLKKLLSCDKVICFGDGKNDISMFKMADECYAVENADIELKEIATGIIESNNCDGVAKRLLQLWDNLLRGNR